MTTKRQRARTAQHVRSAAARAERLLPSTGAVDDLVRALSVERNRSIRLFTEDLGPYEPSGFWIATQRHDWIVVPKGIGAAQRTAIICHELAHMLLGHVPLGSDADLDELVRLVAPHVDPVIAKRFLARFSYADDLEAEAEALSTLLATKLAYRAERLRMMHDAVSDRLR